MQNQRSSLEDKVAQLEAELKAANAEKAKYKKLFDVSADALSIIDLSTGKFVECNQAAIELHGVQSEENFLNIKPSDISPQFQPCGKPSEDMARDYIDKTFTEGPQIFQWTHSKLDGSTFPCLVSLTALPAADKNLVLAIGRNISELIHTQTELKKAKKDINHFQSAYFEEKEKFEQFVNLAPIGIAINRMEDGSFEYVNDEFSRFTGYDVDELNRMDYWQLTPKKYEQQEQEQLTSLAEIGRYGPYHKEYTHKQGHTYPVLLSGIKIAKSTGEEYIWSVVQDISQQTKIEEQIQEAKKLAEQSAFRLKLANDSAGIGVWEWDLGSNTLIWDDWMYALYGITKNQFSGAYEAWEQSVHPDDIDYAKNRLFGAVEGTCVYDPEFRVVHPDGKMRTIKAGAEVIRDEEGKALKVVGVNYDVTDKVNAISKLQLAKQHADEANQSKTEFLANMSHEIRTPMNAILGGLQLLNNAKLSDELQTILDNAAFSAKSLLTIIGDILDYSKIAENKLDLERKPFSLIDVIESVKFDLDTLASNKGIAFNSVIDDSFEDGWVGDIVRVKQIVLNLVSNAVKFTEKGSVTIKLSCECQQEQNAVCIHVIDTGIGMSKEAQSRVFERFAQADSSTTRKFGGTGLGMSITVNLISMMGGSLDLQSIVDKGTTIKVLLPLAQAAEFQREETQKSVAPPQLTGKKLLIAEDNEINQAIIQSMLNATNADLTFAANGKEAVAAAKENVFDLILMDIQMPEMDGVEAQQQISDYDKSIPVIALTANVMVSDINRYLKQGFVAHIGKPVDMSSLYALLTQFLNNKQDN